MRQLCFPFFNQLAVTPRWKFMARRVVRLLHEFESENPFGRPPRRRRVALLLHVANKCWEAAITHSIQPQWGEVRKKKLYTTLEGVAACC